MKNRINTVKTLASAALVTTMLLGTQANAGNKDSLKFPLVRPAVLTSACAPDAKGKVKVVNYGGVELMSVKIEGLPVNTEFDVFVIQVPNAPFGMSWYQGDIQTNKHGKGYAQFLGRFNEETFIVAPGDKPSVAPLTHPEDAGENPLTKPIHTYHVGIWFNSPDDAAKAGCPTATTPFNGEHNAGIQILNTSTFEDDKGPLLDLKP